MKTLKPSDSELIFLNCRTLLETNPKGPSNDLKRTLEIMLRNNNNSHFFDREQISARFNKVKNFYKTLSERLCRSAADTLSKRGVNLRVVLTVLFQAVQTNEETTRILDSVRHRFLLLKAGLEDDSFERLEALEKELMEAKRRLEQAEDSQALEHSLEVCKAKVGLLEEEFEDFRRKLESVNSERLAGERKVFLEMETALLQMCGAEDNTAEIERMAAFGAAKILTERVKIRKEEEEAEMLREAENNPKKKDKKKNRMSKAGGSAHEEETEKLKLEIRNQLESNRENVMQMFCGGKSGISGDVFQMENIFDKIRKRFRNRSDIDKDLKTISEELLEGRIKTIETERTEMSQMTDRTTPPTPKNKKANKEKKNSKPSPSQMEMGAHWTGTPVSTSESAAGILLNPRDLAQIMNVDLNKFCNELKRGIEELNEWESQSSIETGSNTLRTEDSQMSSRAKNKQQNKNISSIIKPKPGKGGKSKNTSSSLNSAPPTPHSTDTPESPQKSETEPGLKISKFFKSIEDPKQLSILRPESIESLFDRFDLSEVDRSKDAFRNLLESLLTWLKCQLPLPKLVVSFRDLAYPFKLNLPPISPISPIIFPFEALKPTKSHNSQTPEFDTKGSLVKEMTLSVLKPVLKPRQSVNNLGDIKPEPKHKKGEKSPKASHNEQSEVLDPSLNSKTSNSQNIQERNGQMISLTKPSNRKKQSRKGLDLLIIDCPSELFEFVANLISQEKSFLLRKQTPSPVQLFPPNRSTAMLSSLQKFVRDLMSLRIEERLSSLTKGTNRLRLAAEKLLAHRRKKVAELDSRLRNKCYLIRKEQLKNQALAFSDLLLSFSQSLESSDSSFQSVQGQLVSELSNIAKIQAKFETRIERSPSQHSYIKSLLLINEEGLSALADCSEIGQNLLLKLEQAAKPQIVEAFNLLKAQVKRLKAPQSKLNISRSQFRNYLTRLKTHSKFCNQMILQKIKVARQFKTRFEGAILSAKEAISEKGQHKKEDIEAEVAEGPIFGRPRKRIEAFLSNEFLLLDNGAKELFRFAKDLWVLSESVKSKTVVIAVKNQTSGNIQGKRTSIGSKFAIGGASTKHFSHFNPSRTVGVSLENTKTRVSNHLKGKSPKRKTMNTKQLKELQEQTKSNFSNFQLNTNISNRLKSFQSGRQNQSSLSLMSVNHCAKINNNTQALDLNTPLPLQRVSLKPIEQSRPTLDSEINLNSGITGLATSSKPRDKHSNNKNSSSTAVNPTQTTSPGDLPHISENFKPENTQGDGTVKFLGISVQPGNLSTRGFSKFALDVNQFKSLLIQLKSGIVFFSRYLELLHSPKMVSQFDTVLDPQFSGLIMPSHSFDSLPKFFSRAPKLVAKHTVQNVTAQICNISESKLSSFNMCYELN